MAPCSWAPYRRIFLLDDARGDEDDTPVAVGVETPPSDAVRARFFQDVASTLYTALVATDALPRFEGHTAHVPIKPWGTMQVTEIDLPRPALESVVASHVALNSLAGLARYA